MLSRPIFVILKFVKQWKLQPACSPDSQRLGAELKLSPLLINVLMNRGLVTREQIEGFLSPKLAGLKDPHEIPNIQAAVRRALLAKERGEKVIVFGDYDVDGVTGTAILVSTLRFLGFDASYYIPDRYGEGYSLSLESVKKIAASGVKLIITVDCGISSLIEIEEANALGVEVIVTDHHNLPHVLPKALAIVNPKQIRGEHPSKNLSGAGVAFKFAWALLRAAGIKDSVFLTSLLDLASLGTVSDVVPLTAENRILAVGGLNQINERKRLGLRQLAESASLPDKISVNNIYFGLAPRLNAAGRLEHASKSVDLLLTDDPIQAKELAQEISRINTRRQSIGASIKEEAFAKLKDEFSQANKLIVLAGENWHAGVIGIIASQIVEAFNRPAVLIGINNGTGRGSARSVDGLNIYDILNSCHDLFLDFGGHAGAAGFEVKTDDIPELKRRLEAKAADSIRAEDLIPTVEIDAAVEPAQITLNLIKELERLAPFGEGNAEPVLMSSNLTLKDFKTVGKEGKHLKAWFEKDGVNLETIGFGLGESQLIVGNNYDIAFNLESNVWNGFEKAQLGLVDIRESNSSPSPFS